MFCAFCTFLSLTSEVCRCGRFLPSQLWNLWLEPYLEAHTFRSLQTELTVCVKATLQFCLHLSLMRSIWKAFEASEVKTIIIGAVPDRGGVPEGECLALCCEAFTKLTHIDRGYTVEDIAKDIVKANVALTKKDQGSVQKHLETLVNCNHLKHCELALPQRCVRLYRHIAPFPFDWWAKCCPILCNLFEILVT